MHVEKLAATILIGMLSIGLSSCDLIDPGGGNAGAPPFEGVEESVLRTSQAKYAIGPDSTVAIEYDIVNPAASPIYVRTTLRAPTVWTERLVGGEWQSGSKGGILPAEPPLVVEPGESHSGVIRLDQRSPLKAGTYRLDGYIYSSIDTEATDPSWSGTLVPKENRVSERFVIE